MSLLELSCHVDDFCQSFEPLWQRSLVQQGARHRNRLGQLSMSEIMTIVIHFHQSHYRTFKSYYCEHVLAHLHREFPRAVSYQRFVELMPGVLIPLLVYVQSCAGPCTGISFVDSTPLQVCLNRRIARHKVFAGLAARGKTSMGWFYGFKLHLVVNDRGELLTFRLTPANVDDRHPVPDMARALFGKLFGDKGYLSQALFTLLFDQGIELITHIRKNMKNRLLPLADKLLLRKHPLS